MRRIVQSLGLVVVSISLIAGGTFAFFNDTETSTDNTFVAGDLDLKVDNETYYNGSLIQGLSWLQKNLVTGDLFYSFSDVKPGDWGENTISLHVNSNDSWLCLNSKVTSSNENIIRSPEVVVGDITDDPNGGELHKAINFIYWADDGDNVFESDENLVQSPMVNATISATTTVALADSLLNIWTNNSNPFAPGVTRFLGAGWCFGSTTPQPVAQDGLSDGSGNNPTVNPGFSCDGSGVSNTTQTDSMLLDISFYSVQSRNNNKFVCKEEVQPALKSLVVDNLNGYSDGSIVGQGNWLSYVNGSNYLIQGADSFEGSKSIYIDTLGDSVITKATTTPLADGRQGFYIKTVNRANWGLNTDGNVQMRVSKGPWASGGPNLPFAAISFKKDGNVAYYDSVNDLYQNFDTYSDGVWTLVEFEWRSVDKKARYRVNSGAWTTWLAFQNNNLFTDFDNVGLDFVQPSGSGGVYIDTLN